MVHAFRRQWSRKESFVKARGDGLAFALCRARFHPSLPPKPPLPLLPPHLTSARGTKAPTPHMAGSYSCGSSSGLVALRSGAVRLADGDARDGDGDGDGGGSSQPLGELLEGISLPCHSMLYLDPEEDPEEAPELSWWSTFTQWWPSTTVTSWQSAVLGNCASGRAGGTGTVGASPGGNDVRASTSSAEDASAAIDMPSSHWRCCTCGPAHPKPNRIHHTKPHRIHHPKPPRIHQSFASRPLKVLSPGSHEERPHRKRSSSSCLIGTSLPTATSSLCAAGLWARRWTLTAASAPPLASHTPLLSNCRRISLSHRLRCGVSP